MTGAVGQPARECGVCPPRRGFREENRGLYPDWFNAPVPSFGPIDARLLIVGLASGLRGANRTGRPFTGDYAGDLLYAKLVEHGFAHGHYDKRPDDGLNLVDCRITNGVRCVPPQNKPVGQEINACRRFLAGELAAMPNLRLVLALGAIAHGTVLSALGEKKSRWPFGHGALHRVPGGPVLVDSYHCSRYNTNTGRLTTAMFDRVIATLRSELAR